MKQILTTVDRFEGEYAVLRHKDHEILMPKEDMPEEAVEGSVIAVTVMTQEQSQKDRAETAKELINDILNDALGEGAVDTRPEAERFREREIEILEKESKQLGDEEKRLEDLGKKLDDLNKRLKG